MLDHKYPPQNDLLDDAKDLYGYSAFLLVDETFKDFADSVCRHFRLQYPPLSHEDALYIYIDECRKLS